MTKDEIEAVEAKIEALVAHLKRRRAPQTVIRSATEVRLAIDWCRNNERLRPR